jgi:hypothetical protein
MADTPRDVIGAARDRAAVRRAAPHASGSRAETARRRADQLVHPDRRRLKPGATIEQVKGNLAGPFEQAARAGMSASWPASPTPSASCRATSAKATPCRAAGAPGARGIYDLDRTSSRSASVLERDRRAAAADRLRERREPAAVARGGALSRSVGAPVDGRIATRLVRQLLTESLLLSGTGGALGIALGYWSKKLLPFGQNTRSTGRCSHSWPASAC